MEALKTSFNSPPYPTDPKSQAMDRVRQEAALANARMLIENINTHCFERCVPKPGSSLGKGEQTCITQCMEKYMAAWNTASRQYISRIQRERERGAPPFTGS